ncbi:MAG: hypothetical protein WCW68_07325 [Methanothrix sp.]
MSNLFQYSIKKAYNVVYGLFALMLDRARLKLNRKVTNLSTSTLALSLFIVGTGVRWFMGSPYWVLDNALLTDLFKEVSGLVAAAGLVALIWEISLRRTFFDEVMEKVGLATDVDKAGLIGVTTQFYREIDWQTLFRNVEKLDILFSYGGTWRSFNTLELSEAANRPDVSVRVILPSPTDDLLMDQLSRRYNITKDAMVTKIKDAEADFHNKFDDPHIANLTIIHTNMAPVFDIYKFDDVAVITLFSHRKGKTSVPAFLVKKDGTLYKFIEDEFNSFVEGTTHAA